MLSVEASKLKVLLQSNEQLVRRMSVDTNQKDYLFGSPSSEDLSPLIENQAAVERQLHEQVSFYQDALSKLKLRSEKICEKNAMLYERMRQSAMESTYLESESTYLESESSSIIDGVKKKDLYAQTILNLKEQYEVGVNVPVLKMDPHKDKSQSYTNDDMMQMKRLYDVKTSHLQTLLKAALKTIDQQQKDNAELRSEARLYKIPVKDVKDVFNAGFSKCCLENSNHSQSAHGLSDSELKSNKDLFESLQAQQKFVSESKKREAEAYSQLKKNCELVEQLQLEKQEVCIQNKQLREDLLMYKEKYKELLKAMHDLQQNFNDIKKKEMQFQIESLEKKNDELTFSLNSLSAQLDKVIREKTTMKQECQKMKDELVSHKSETSALTENLQKNALEAIKARTLADQELKELHLKNILREKQKRKEIEELKMEVEHIRQRMRVSENAARESQAKVVSLAQDLNSCTHRLQTEFFEKESLLSSFTEEKKSIICEGELREQRLTALLREKDLEFHSLTEELSSVIESQKDIIKKYKIECDVLSERLTQERISKKEYLFQLSSKYRKLELQAAAQCDAIKTKDNIVHEQKKEVERLETIVAAQTEEILHLINKQSSLLHERQLLTKEIELLRCQATL